MKLHAVPLQLGTAFAGVEQSAHVVPHARYPASQVSPQLVPLQVAVPFADMGHAVHELPQLLTDVLGRHCEPQR